MINPDYCAGCDSVNPVSDMSFDLAGNYRCAKCQALPQLPPPPIAPMLFDGKPMFPTEEQATAYAKMHGMGTVTITAQSNNFVVGSPDHLPSIEAMG